MLMLCIFNVFNVFTEPTLKRKCCHFDEILITDCTESCHFDNFRCSQWLKFRQNDDISVSVYFNLPNAEVLLCLQWQPSPADTRLNNNVIHYDDVIMGTIASQITSLTIVYSAVYSGADQCKHQSSASLAFVWGIHRGPVNSPHKWPVTRKMFPFDDVIMITSKRRRDIMTLLLRCLWRYIKLESLNLNHSSLWNGFYSISMPDNENQKQSRSLWIHKLSSPIFRRNTKKPYRVLFLDFEGVCKHNVLGYMHWDVA